MLTLLTAALMSLRSVALDDLPSGFVARPPPIAATTTTLSIRPASASATSPSAMPSMPATVGAEPVAAISAVTPVPTWGVGSSSPIGYRARIITAGAEGLRLASVLAAGVFAFAFAVSFALTGVVSTVGGVGWR